MTNSRLSLLQEAPSLSPRNEAHSTHLEHNKSHSIEDTILEAVSTRLQASFLLRSIESIVESSLQENKTYQMIYQTLTTSNINTILIPELDQCIKHIASQNQEETDYERKSKLNNLSWSLTITKYAIEYKFCEVENKSNAKKELESAIQTKGNFIFFNLSGAYLDNIELIQFDFSGLYLTGASFKESRFIQCPNYLMVLMSDDKKNVEEKNFMPFQNSALLKNFLDQRIINSMIFLFFASIKQNFDSVDQEFDRLFDLFRFKIDKNPNFSLSAMLSLYHGLFPLDEFPINDSRLEYFKHMNHFFACLSSTFIEEKSIEHLSYQEIIAFYQTKIIDLTQSAKETLGSDSQFNTECAQYVLNYAITQFETVASLKNLMHVFRIVTAFKIMPPKFIALLSESKHYELLKKGIDLFEASSTGLSEESQWIIDDIQNRVIQLDDTNADPINFEMNHTKEKHFQAVETNNLNQKQDIFDGALLTDNNVALKKNETVLTDDGAVLTEQEAENETTLTDDGAMLTGKEAKNETTLTDDGAVLTEQEAENETVLTDDGAVLTEQEAENETLLTADETKIEAENETLLIDDVQPEKIREQNFIVFPSSEDGGIENQKPSNTASLLLTKTPSHQPAEISSKKEMSSPLSDNHFFQNSSFDLADTEALQAIKTILDITEDFQNPFLKKLLGNMMGASYPLRLQNNPDENAATQKLHDKSTLLDQIEMKFSNLSNHPTNNELNLAILIHLAQIIFLEYTYQSMILTEKALNIHQKDKSAQLHSGFELEFKTKINHYLISLFQLIKKNIKLNTQEIDTFKITNVSTIAYRVIIGIFFRIKEKNIESDLPILNNISSVLDKILQYWVHPLTEQNKNWRARFFLQQVLLATFAFNDNKSNSKNAPININHIFHALEQISQNDPIATKDTRVHLWLAWSGLIQICHLLFDKKNNFLNRVNDHKQKTKKKAKGFDANSRATRKDDTKSLPVVYLRSLLNSIQPILDKATNSLKLISDISKEEDSILIKSPLPTPLVFLKKCLPLLPSLEDFREKKLSEMNADDLSAWDSFIQNFHRLYEDLKNVLVHLNSNANWFMEVDHPVQYFKEFLSQTIEPGLKLILDEMRNVHLTKKKLEENISSKSVIAENNYQALITDSVNQKKLLKEKKAKLKIKKEIPGKKPELGKESTEKQESVSPDSNTSKVSPNKNRELINDEARSLLKNLQSLDSKISRKAKNLLEEVNKELRLPLSTRKSKNTDFFKNQAKDIKKEYDDFQKKCRFYEEKYLNTGNRLSLGEEINFSEALSFIKGIIYELSIKIESLSEESNKVFHVTPPTQTNHYVSADLNSTSKQATPSILDSSSSATNSSATKNENETAILTQSSIKSKLNWASIQLSDQSNHPEIFFQPIQSQSEVFSESLEGLKSLTDILKFVLEKSVFSDEECRIFLNFIRKFQNRPEKEDDLLSSDFSYKFLCTKFLNINLDENFYLLKRLEVLKILIGKPFEPWEKTIYDQKAWLANLEKIKDQISTSSSDKIIPAIALSQVLKAILMDSFPREQLKNNLLDLENPQLPLYKTFFKLNLDSACRSNLHTLLSMECLDTPKFDNEMPFAVLKVRKYIINHNRDIIDLASINGVAYYLYRYGSSAIFDLYDSVLKSNDQDYLTNVPYEKLVKIIDLRKISKLSDVDVYHHVSNEKGKNGKSDINYTMSIKINRHSLFDELYHFDFTIHQIMINCLSNQPVFFTHAAKEAKAKKEIKSILPILHYPSDPQKFLRLLTSLKNYQLLSFSLNKQDRSELKELIEKEFESARQNKQLFLGDLFKDKERVFYFLSNKLIGQEYFGYIDWAHQLKLIGFMLPIPLSALPLSPETFGKIKESLFDLDQENVNKKVSSHKRLIKIISRILFYSVANLEHQALKAYQQEMKDQVNHCFPNMNLFDEIQKELAILSGNKAKPKVSAVHELSLFKNHLDATPPKNEVIVLLVPSACNLNEFPKGPDTIILFREQSEIMAARGESKISLTSLQLYTLDDVFKEANFSFEKSKDFHLIEGKNANVIEEIINLKSVATPINTNPKKL